MRRLSFTTAGESHGPNLTVILSGLPAGLKVQTELLNDDLARRQHGYGRGGRMKIEKDAAVPTGGVRGGETLGGPISLEVQNRDFAVWEPVMSPVRIDPDAARKRALTSPRPGHADLAGGLKYRRRDLRDILERASARESAARVAAGSLCRMLLLHFGIQIRSGVLSIGSVRCPLPKGGVSFSLLSDVDESSPLRLVDRTVEADAIRLIDLGFKEGDTLGGSILVGARGVPPGLGSHVAWDEKLDGRIAQAMLSIPSVKAVSLGDGIENAFRFGSEAHDAIEFDPRQGFTRPTNRAGGLEGGITNGQDILVTLFQKPISTLRNGLPSVDIETKEPVRAQYERSDVTAVPACGVIGEAMLALILADAFLAKTGGDSLEEVAENYQAFMAAQRAY